METKDFALRLARLRTQKGVSAREMSSFIGRNEGYINNLELGNNLPSFGVFFKICEYLGVTPKEFFDFETPNPSKLDDIVTDMKKLNDEQLDTIAALVKGLSKK